VSGWPAIPLAERRAYKEWRFAVIALVKYYFILVQSGSFYHQAKAVRKTLIHTVF
jgi:hypothetical protein